MAEKSKSAKKKPAKKGKSSTELAAAKSTIKKLRATVEKLEAKVAKLEKKAIALKSDAKKGAKKGAQKAAQPMAPPAAEPAAAFAAQDTRTVAQLRAEAKSRGVAGYSRLRKDQLLAVLN